MAAGYANKIHGVRAETDDMPDTYPLRFKLAVDILRTSGNGQVIYESCEPSQLRLKIRSSTARVSGSNRLGKLFPRVQLERLNVQRSTSIDHTEWWEALEFTLKISTIPTHGRCVSPCYSATFCQPSPAFSAIISSAPSSITGGDFLRPFSARMALPLSVCP